MGHVVKIMNFTLMQCKQRGGQFQKIEIKKSAYFHFQSECP